MVSARGGSGSVKDAIEQYLNSATFRDYGRSTGPTASDPQRIFEAGSRQSSACTDGPQIHRALAGDCVDQGSEAHMVLGDQAVPDVGGRERAPDRGRPDERHQGQGQGVRRSRHVAVDSAPITPHRMCLGYDVELFS